MIDLRRYGLIHFQRSGAANCTLNGEDITCEFQLAQYHDAYIRIKCEVNLVDGVNTLRIDPNTEVTLENFRGETEDGESVSVIGRTIVTNFKLQVGQNENSLTLIAVVVGDLICRSNIAENDFTRLEFDVVNLRFLGNEWEQIDEDGGRRGLRLQIPLDESVFFRKVGNYSEVEKELRASKRPRVTCSLDLSNDQNRETSEIETIASNLMMMLSLALGTKISWIGYRKFSDDTLVTSLHRNAVTADYVNMMVIDNRNPDDIANFISQTYSTYLDLSTTYNFNLVIHSLVAARSGSFLELRCYSLVGLVEYLCTTHAVVTGQPTILNSDDFEALVPALQNEMRSLLETQITSLDRGGLDAMAAKAAGLNYRSFGSKCRQLRRDFNLSISTNEITEFKNRRDRLVHYMDFSDEDGATVWLEMLRFVDKIVLGMLGYDGHYIDPVEMNRMRLR